MRYTGIVKSFFEKVPAAPADPIFGINETYKADPRGNKFSFVVGYYLNEDGATPLMRAVRQAEKRLAERGYSKEYLPIEGDAVLRASLGRLVFGEPFNGASAQTVGGTGALRLFADFAKMHLADTIYLSQPTWPNHRNVFARAGLKIETYSYYPFDFEKIYDQFSKLQRGSIVLLHACCHNPTGIDFSLEQWGLLADLFEKNGLFPFFDMAYQGFSKGLEEDAIGIRLFMKKGLELAVAYSCAKNFSLYSERVGALFIKSQNQAVMTQLKALIRSDYSNPPSFGARLVCEVLNSDLAEDWKKELGEMRTRIKEMRALLAKALGWEFLLKTNGLFCITGLNGVQIEALIKEHAIYMPNDGRINVTALNKRNLSTIAKAISEI